MTTMPLEDYESEADYDSEGEDYGEVDYGSEGEDYEDARSDAIRRARARRIALGRRRTAMQRTRRPVTTVSRTPTPRQTVAAIKNLDLESKVSDDSLRRAIDQVNRRAARATYATVASVALDQALDTFEADLAGHEFVRAGLRAAPLLLLAPQRRPGLEGVLLDPRVIGAAAIAGVVAIGALRERDDDVDLIEVDVPDLDVTSPHGRFVGIAVNKRGADTGATVTWNSLDSTVLSVDSAGNFTVVAAGTARVTASAGGRTRTVFVKVKPTPAEVDGLAMAPPAFNAPQQAAAQNVAAKKAPAKKAPAKKAAGGQ
jgi:hypothetical protein